MLGNASPRLDRADVLQPLLRRTDLALYVCQIKLAFHHAQQGDIGAHARRETATVLQVDGARRSAGCCGNHFFQPHS